MNRHPWARNRRREPRGARWDDLARALHKAEAPTEAAQERAGEAQPQAVVDASVPADRAASAVG